MLFLRLHDFLFSVSFFYIPHNCVTFEGPVINYGEGRGLRSATTTGPISFKVIKRGNFGNIDACIIFPQTNRINNYYNPSMIKKNILVLKYGI